MGDIDFINGVNQAANNVFAYVFIDPKSLDHRDIHSTANRDYVREELLFGLTGLATSVSTAEVDRVIDAALINSPSVGRWAINVPGSIEIDPRRLDSKDAHSAANRDFIRGALDGHLANLGRSMNNAQLDGIIDNALKAPAGAKSFQITNLQASFVVVNTQGANADSKNEIARVMSGIRADRLKTVPGTTAIWDRLVGEHEGEHGNRDNVNAPTLREIIVEEARADLQSLQWLRANGHNDVAQALMDYRVLSAVHSADATHATGVALIAGNVNGITNDYMFAARNMGAAILQAVSDEHGLGSERNALRMLEYNPGRFIRTVERALNRGEFSGPGVSPDMEDHVKAYIAAFRRQVDGITPPVPSGARASVDLENGTTPKLIIGGVTAPEFFASIADPAQAQAAVASNDAVFAETSVRAPAENPDPPKVAGMKVA